MERMERMEKVDENENHFKERLISICQNENITVDSVSELERIDPTYFRIIPTPFYYLFKNKNISLDIIKKVSEIIYKDFQQFENIINLFSYKTLVDNPKFLEIIGDDCKRRYNECIEKEPLINTFCPECKKVITNGDNVVSFLCGQSMHKKCYTKNICPACICLLIQVPTFSWKNDTPLLSSFGKKMKKRKKITNKSKSKSKKNNKNTIKKKVKN